MIRRVAALLVVFGGLLFAPSADAPTTAGMWNAAAEAREAGRPPPRNLYGLNDRQQYTSNEVTQKLRIFPTIDGTTGIFPTIGQSRIANNSAAPATPYTPTNGSKCIVLSPIDGFFYVATDPVPGASATPGYYNSGIHGRLCDSLINAGKYTQVIFVPMAMSGASIADFDAGGNYRDRIRAVSEMLSAKSITPTAWLMQIGTTDSIDGMTQAAFTTKLRAVIAYQRGLSGRSSDKWMIAKDTIYGTSNTTSADIRAAVAAVAADPNNYLGPDIDTLTYPSNSDGTHLNDSGNLGSALIWRVAIAAAF